MLYSIVFSTLFIVIMGCKKVYDYVDIHTDADIKICPIQQFIFSTPYSNYIDTLSFKYNIWGNPLSVTRPDPRTGAPNYEFRYDKNGRLTNFIGVYSNKITTEFWHRYFYDGLGRIVTDSVYIFANIVNGELSNPYDSYVLLLNYDIKNRISKETRIWDGNTDIANYSYDANGNKFGSIYDQKTSFRRTNKIWMFLDRDYSLNNAFQAITYNSFGLPTKIGPSQNISNGVFLDNYFIVTTIQYLCDNQNANVTSYKDY